MMFMRQRSLAERCINFAHSPGWTTAWDSPITSFSSSSWPTRCCTACSSQPLCCSISSSSGRWVAAAAGAAADADLLAHGSTDERPLEWLVHGADLSPCFLSPFPSSALWTSLVFARLLSPSFIKHTRSLFPHLCLSLSATSVTPPGWRSSFHFQPFCLSHCFDLLFSPSLTFVKRLPANSECLSTFT